MHRCVIGYTCFFSDYCTNLGYYTIECGMLDKGFLCEWDKNKNHLNYHNLKSRALPEKSEGVWTAIETKLIIDIHAKSKNCKWRQNNRVIRN